MTAIMGILNVTPDSFSDGGRYVDVDVAVGHGIELRAAGADIIDVGGESTRPGAERVEAEVERTRVLPVIEALAARGFVVSVDTMNAATAAAAVAAGARIVNDVSGGLADDDMFAAVAPTDADIVIGHWRGHSADMYATARYDDVVAEVVAELQDRIAAAATAGIAPSRIVLDPGIGFGKRGEQNWTVLRHLDRVVGLGKRVLVGTSRKGFLADALEGDPERARRDAATAVTSVLAAEAGAWGVRVHDVAATRDALAVRRAWREGV
ncbi:dihydropteroate synthase [Microbacterium imperiale]|uniref:Dihydropteroate synthase n=1 Tax=Microbacterium imperiale TaxID=33884 RepID=A0A9W6M491_9MICO|nr:dihydropteroate synthase [Microbacterium imperiale]MBP2421262.1 dihydropteroate synthase [Microbacterium imperiale]MDS0199627.1 dihydropteroate synthase [Microbacterium imperiale]BFE41601.1 dihydropteroate synthase [Microbacterium imperiale]GLJ80552.1 dihydropteroate synthase [Microbacterium imperiale]